MSINRPRQNSLICSDNSMCEVMVSSAGSGTPSGVFDLAIHTPLLDKLKGLEFYLNDYLSLKLMILLLI